MKISKDSLLTTRRIAHRGLHDNKTIPENSLAAFRNAVDHGYGIELDVYLTDDGTLIVHHDPSLKRTCGVRIHPEKIDSSHLENYRLMNTGETIPRLKDVLDLVGGKIGLVIEIKTTRKVDAVCEAVRDILKDYDGEYWIESFDPRIVHWWHEHCPDVVLGQLYDIYALQRLYARKLGTHKYIDFIASQCGIVTKPFFGKVRAARPEVVTVVWTVRTPDQLAHAVREADNFIFESNLKNSGYIPLPDPIVK